MLRSLTQRDLMKEVMNYQRFCSSLIDYENYPCTTLFFHLRIIQKGGYSK